MQRIVSEALKAGALGFSTSRTVGHRSVQGEPIPGTFAAEEELLAIADAMKEARSGVFQAIPAGTLGDLVGPEKDSIQNEIKLFARVAGRSGRKCTFTLIQNASRPDEWRDVLEIVERAAENGIEMRPQVPSRPIGFLTNLNAYHMFARRETYLKLADLPLEQRLAEMRKPKSRHGFSRTRTFLPISSEPWPISMVCSHSPLRACTPLARRSTMNLRPPRTLA